MTISQTLLGRATYGQTPPLEYPSTPCGSSRYIPHCEAARDRCSGRSSTNNTPEGRSVASPAFSSESEAQLAAFPGLMPVDLLGTVSG